MARGSRKAFVLITTGMSNKRRWSSRTVGGATIVSLGPLASAEEEGPEEQFEGSLQAERMLCQPKAKPLKYTTHQSCSQLSLFLSNSQD